MELASLLRKETNLRNAVQILWTPNVLAFHNFGTNADAMSTLTRRSEISMRVSKKIQETFFIGN